MQKIVPNLWFDTQAVEAADFYTSVFPDAKITLRSVIKDTPSGDCDLVVFEIRGYEFQAMSGGPQFTINPSISIMVNFDPSRDPEARRRIDEVWDKLAEGGRPLMPIDTYPFSERYGWIEDKFGLSWQLIFTKPEGEERPSIVPSMLFVTEDGRQTEAATDFYLTVFKDARRGALLKYPAGAEPNKEGAVMFTDFALAGQWFAAMDGVSSMHKFKFSEALSFVVVCDDQAEVDYYWQKLSAVPEAAQCGWLKDQFGVSWQIVPRRLMELVAGPDKERATRVTQALLKMKKLVIADLEAAAEGK